MELGELPDYVQVGQERFSTEHYQELLDALMPLDTDEEVSTTLVDGRAIPFKHKRTGEDFTRQWFRATTMSANE